MSESIQDKDDQPDYYKVFQNDIRFQIWGLLSIFPELSFTEICRKLSRSKSTVHHHLQKLLEIGVVEVIREEKVRGSIPAKIYSLRSRSERETIFACGIGSKPCPSLVTGEQGSGTIQELLDMGIDKNLSERVIQGEKLIEMYFKTIHVLRLEYLDKLFTDDNSPDVINEMFGNKEVFNSIIFLTESQHQRLRVLVQPWAQPITQ